MNLNSQNLQNIYLKDHSKKGIEDYLSLTFKEYSSSTLLFDDSGKLLKYGSVRKLFPKNISDISYRQLLFCFCENDIDSLAGYFYFLSVKAIPMMIKLDSSKDQVSNLIRQYCPSFIWIKKNHGYLFDGYDEIYNLGNYTLLHKKNNIVYEINPDLALLIGTSGSTGNSKFVRLSYKNIISNAISISEYLNLNSSEIPITTLKPSYTFALSILHSHLIKGASIAVTKRTLFEKQFWNFLELSNATSISGVPYHYQIMKKLKFHRQRNNSIRNMTQAGGRIDLETAKYFRELCVKRNIDFYIMYGQSEGTARLSYLSPCDINKKIGSIGKAIPGGEFWIEDKNKKLIRKPNIEGELVYSGPNVCMGYANNLNDLGKGDENNFILYTGDIAYKDQDNFYYVTGRIKRFIKLFGHRINLVDLEKWFEKNSVIAICKGEDDALEIYFENIKELNFNFEIFLGEFKIPKHIVKIYSVNKFPIGESGKVLYKELNSTKAKQIV